MWATGIKNYSLSDYVKAFYCACILNHLFFTVITDETMSIDEYKDENKID